MDKVPVMNIFNACDQLVSKEEHSLEGEAARAEVEKIFQ